MYPTARLKYHFRISMLFLARLYGEKDGTMFHESWVPMVNEICTHGSEFKWSAIMSSSLYNDNKAVKSAMPTSLFSSSYLLDSIYS